jgi:hypothetical protein
LKSRQLCSYSTPNILCNPNVHYRVHTSTPLVPTLSQIQSKPPHSLSPRSTLLSTHRCLGLPNGLFPSAFVLCITWLNLFTLTHHGHAHSVSPYIFFSLFESLLQASVVYKYCRISGGKPSNKQVFMVYAAATMDKLSETKPVRGFTPSYTFFVHV